MDFSKKIQLFQQKMHFSQDEICKRTGFKRDYIVGNVSPNVEIAFCIAFNQATDLDCAPYIESINPAWIRKFPIRALQRKGYIPEGLADTDLTRAVLSFMGVGSIEGFRNYYAATLNSANPQTYAAWIRMGELSIKRATKEFTLDNEFVINGLKYLKQNILLRTTLQKNHLRESTKEILNHSGIEFIEVEPFLTAAYPICACYWVGNQPVIQVSTTEMSDSTFLEAVYHAVAHIMLHPKRTMCLIAPQGSQQAAKMQAENSAKENSNIQEDTQTQQIQIELAKAKCAEATRFAQDMLLSEAEECELICSGHFEEPKCIKYFAGIFRVRPGVLVERLQQQGKIKRRTPLNELKQAV